VFSSVTYKFFPRNHQGQQSKKEAEEYPAGQEFPHVKEIQANSQQQSRELRNSMAFMQIVQGFL